jgi:CheY-like chemotaxis protein
MKQRAVLVVEDDIELAHLLDEKVRERFHGAKVYMAHDPYEAMNMMAEKAYDLVLLDWNLPGFTGTETMAQAAKDFDFDPNLPLAWREKPTPVMVMSANPEESCGMRNNRYFTYAGHVNKCEGLTGILNRLSQHLVMVQ